MSASSSRVFDIVIVGAGLVGATLANRLLALPSSDKLTIAIVESGAVDVRQFSGAEFDPRVVALTHASQRQFEHLGVWEQVKAARACAYTGMQVWDAEGTGAIEFSARNYQCQNLGHIVENSLLVHQLRKALLDAERIAWFHASVERIESTASGYTLQLCEAAQVEGRLIVAADGAHSRVRELAGLATRAWSYGQDAMVATVQMAQPHEFVARQRFLVTGPLAFLPLQQGPMPMADERYCSIVWSMESSQTAHLMSLDDEDFAERLASALEHRLGRVEHLSRRFSFPLRQQHAVDYVCEGIALVGDAAHTIHPLAGQGVNLGLLDVDALVIEIDRALKRGLAINDTSILRRYQRQRKWHNLSVMGVMEGFKQLFGTDQMPLRWLRNEGMRRVNKMQGLKKLIVKQAMGL